MTLGKSSVNVSHNELEPPDDVIEVQKSSEKRKAEKDKEKNGKRKRRHVPENTAKNWQSSFMEMLENTNFQTLIHTLKLVTQHKSVPYSPVETRTDVELVTLAYCIVSKRYLDFVT